MGIRVCVANGFAQKRSNRHSNRGDLYNAVVAPRNKMLRPVAVWQSVVSVDLGNRRKNDQFAPSVGEFCPGNWAKAALGDDNVLR